MRRVIPWIEYTELAVLYFLHAMATAMWFVPLSGLLKEHGLQLITPYAFATTAVAALISPLVFGAMADRHVSPVKVLRWLSVATAVTITLFTLSVQHGCKPWLVLALMQLHALCFAPTASITTTIIFSRLRNAQTEFGPVRAMATIGWMCGCWLVSAMSADTSPRSGYTDAGLWLVLAAYTFLLPEVTPAQSTERLTLRQRFGWDALELLKNHDHRVVIVTVALFYIPLAAFYPFTPPQMIELGLERTSAWMTLGQVTEVVAMFCLAGLLSKWRLKWIFAVGLGFGVARFACCAMNSKPWVLAGVAMHGLSLVAVLITAQVYVDQRIDPAWRARAQALLLLVTGGIGHLLGYLGTGWWFTACSQPAGTRWSLFWSVLSAAVLAVLVYFLIAYHGIGAAKRSKTASNT